MKATPRIPNGWRSQTLGSVADIIGGGTPSTTEPAYWNGTIPWATPTDITALTGRYIAQTEKTITDAGLSNSGARLLPPQSLLMTSRATIGKCAINTVPMATNQGFASLVCNGGLLTDYAYYLIGSHKKELSRLSSGSTFIELSKRALQDFTVLLPPTVEQQKIATILTSVDDAIERTQSLIAQLGRVKEALLEALLIHGLRHKRRKKTQFGMIPQHWEIRRVKEVAEVDYGISEAVSMNTDPNIGWPILTGANITLDGKLKLIKKVYITPPSKEQFRLKKNDLLLNWRSGSPAHVGKTALFDLDGNYTYASFILRIRARENLLPRFGYYLFNFMRAKGLFSRDQSIQVNFKMNAAVFRDVSIPLPPLSEQEEAVRILDRNECYLDNEQARLSQLSHVKSCLMGVLLSGAKRVPLPQPQTATA